MKYTTAAALAAIMLGAPIIASAQMGWNLKKCKAKLGTLLESWTLDGKYHHAFNKRGLHTTVVMGKNGLVERVEFLRVDNSFSRSEVDKLVSQNVGSDLRWVTTRDDAKTLDMKSTDGAYSWRATRDGKKFGAVEIVRGSSPFSISFPP